MKNLMVFLCLIFSLSSLANNTCKYYKFSYRWVGQFTVNSDETNNTDYIDIFSVFYGQTEPYELSKQGDEWAVSSAIRGDWTSSKPALKLGSDVNKLSTKPSEFIKTGKFKLVTEYYTFVGSTNEAISGTIKGKAYSRKDNKVVGHFILHPRHDCGTGIY